MTIPASPSRTFREVSPDISSQCIIVRVELDKVILRAGTVQQVLCFHGRTLLSTPIPV